MSDVTHLIAAAERLPPPLASALYCDWIAENAADPLLYAVLFNYGVSASAAGALDLAADAYERAVVANPLFFAARINLGSVRERQGDREAALRQWYAVAHAAVPLGADMLAWKVTAWKQIGRVLETARCEAPAEAALREGLSLDPHQADAIQHWIALRQAQCRWPVVEPFAGLTRARLMEGMSPLSLAAHADDPVLQLGNAHRQWREEGVDGAATVGAWPAPAPAERGRRLRVGYLSSDLREHAVGFLTSGIFEHHDRDRVEVFAYYAGPPAAGDGTQARIRGAVDHWRDIAALSDRAAACCIVRDGIDILVDLNGYTRDARTKLVALRPAPVIVNWLGYPGSMGTPHHHYIIADKHVIPPSHERFYSEAVLRLRCYQPNDRRRAVSDRVFTRAECGLPDGGTVFCCFNGANKITEAAFARWMRILARVPASVLWLLATNEETNGRLRARAEALGIDPGRVVFAARMTTPLHLARYRLADVFLDTSPYGAHTTCSDALWMGVPVVTFMGESFASRVCGSLVHAAGVGELVCADKAAYEEEAVRLGQDAALRAALRARLAAGRAVCALFDTPGLVRGLEHLYAGMWAAYCRGALPVPALTNLQVYHQLGCAAAPFGPDGPDVAGWYRAQMAYRHAVCPLPEDAVVWDGAGGALRDEAAALAA